jgi:RND family efflux transporter MFP subunit
MKKTIYSVLLFLAMVAAFLVGSRYGQRGAVTSAATARKVLYYVDPMHPAYKSDKPGTAPDCGMQLEPVYADGGLVTADLDDSPSPLAPGTVRISAARQQLFGVRVSSVEKSSGTHQLRLFGRVAPDEARSYKLNAGIEGFIQEVSAATTGSQVRKNQLLATFSAPNATMIIQTYILNLGAEDRFKKSAAEGSTEAQALPATAANLQQRNQQLQNLGMSPLQMEEIKHTRQVPESIKILAPADGFVLARNVSPGQKFERGMEWFRIANLNRVWILADVFENDAQYLRPGMRAMVSLPHQGKTLVARVSEVLPQFDAATRTLKVRLEVDNPGYILRPDMFVDVELPVALPQALVVPAEAILDSGRSRTVFVERGPGWFEPRSVETGWRFDDRVEIVRGLEPGERIVVSGNFLIGSESRLKEAVAGMPAPEKDSVQKPRDSHVADQPQSFSEKTAKQNQFKDPSCGMAVDPVQASAAGRKSQYRNATYYFCSDSCKRQFDAGLEGRLKKAGASATDNRRSTASDAAPSPPAHGGPGG